VYDSGQNTSQPLADGLALLFDMDGVIIDSNPFHREAWVAYNLQHGLVTTEAMIERMYGRRNDRIVRDFFGDGLSDEEVAARGAAKEELYREMVANHLEEMLVPGLRAFLDLYRGAPMAVASNAEPENVNFVLDRSGLRPYFRAVVDGHQVSRPKPYPDVFLRAAELVEITPSNCIVMEDSPTGIAAARAAGMRVIGIRTTHVKLPDTDITADNFLNGSLTSWLRAQKRAA
jgi:beta-phosphoglucomutase